MRRFFLIGFLAALAVSGLLVWKGFDYTKKNHFEPTGKITNVRVQQLDPKSSIVVVDFSLGNTSAQPFEVRSIESSLVTASGKSLIGSLYSGEDVKSTIQTFPAMGAIVNEPLRERDLVGGQQTVGRMVGIRYDVPAEELEGRKGLVLSVEDVTGPIVEMKNP